MITSSYFQGTLLVPGLDSTDSGSDVSADLALLIARYEKEFLILFMGPEMYLDYVNDTDTGVTIPAGKWHDFINGITTTYTDKYGRPQLWQGLLQTNPLTSAIAYYIYYKYLESKVSNTSITGEKQILVESANNVNIYAKMVDAWNNMVTLNVQAYSYLICQQTAGVNDWQPFIDYMNDAEDEPLLIAIYTYKNSLGI